MTRAGFRSGRPLPAKERAQVAPKEVDGKALRLALAAAGAQPQHPAKREGCAAHEPEHVRRKQSQPAEMLDEVAASRLVPISRPAPRRIPDPGRGAFEVHDARLRHPPHLPAGFAGAPAEIHLLEIEEEALVEEAHLLE